MLIDTHCHMNMMVKNTFDVPLQPEEISAATNILDQARQFQVNRIINVGTNLIESNNCIALARAYDSVTASIGLHPNDGTAQWKEEFIQLQNLVREKESNKIIAIGECGLDFHYPDYDVQRQIDMFRAQIELALEHQLPVIVHTRQAPDETLRVIEEYVPDIRGTIHCFSEDLSFARTVIDWGLVIGIGGTITYPKNEYLRDVVRTVSLENIVLETDAPFLPPQIIRGKQNHPKYIHTIAEYIANLRNQSFEEVAQQTTKNAQRIFLIS